MSSTTDDPSRGTLSEQNGGYLPIPPFQEDRQQASVLTLRHTVTADALLSAEEVIHVLGGRQSVVRRWLRQVPSMWHPSMRRVYRWGDVLDCLRSKGGEAA